MAQSSCCPFFMMQILGFPLKSRPTHLAEGEDVQDVGPVDGHMWPVPVDEVLIGVIHHLGKQRFLMALRASQARERMAVRLEPVLIGLGSRPSHVQDCENQVRSHCSSRNKACTELILLPSLAGKC